MKWLHNFDLFLFDLDGLLVNTEGLHYAAYKEMLRARGYKLALDFAGYYRLASQDSKTFQNYLYETFPDLLPDWSVLYKEKKQAFLDLVASEQAPLMPGAAHLLEELAKLGKKRCVVTHSMKELVDQLKAQQPILNTIPHWITREDYTHPKPAPDGYLTAIEKLGSPGDRLIGFEDSERGMRALLQTPIRPIFVSDERPDMRAHFSEMGVSTFRTLEDMIENFPS